MKRSTLTLITAGMILAGAGAVDLLGDGTAGATPPVPHSDSATIVAGSAR
ncbi:MAG: hypothetical protein J2P18_12650 [Nocardia sp.]|nr:hypothetical protein [Nocardia sp.]